MSLHFASELRRIYIKVHSPANVRFSKANVRFAKANVRRGPLSCGALDGTPARVGPLTAPALCYLVLPFAVKRGHCPTSVHVGSSALQDGSSALTMLLLTIHMTVQTTYICICSTSVCWDILYLPITVQFKHTVRPGYSTSAHAGISCIYQSHKQFEHILIMTSS